MPENSDDGQAPPPSQPWARSTARSVAASPLAVPLPVAPRPWHTLPIMRVFLALAFFTLIICLVGLALALRNYQTPTVNIPTPTMPRPNAFDIYVKASRDLVRPQDIRALYDRKRKFTGAEKAALLQANKKALAGFRSGFGMAYQAPPWRFVFDIPAYYKDFLTGARLFALESEEQYAKDNVVGAMASALDAVELGKQMTHGDSNIGGGAGIFGQEIGRYEAWDSVYELDAAAAKAAARRMEKISAKGSSLAESLTEDKRGVQATALSLFNDPEKFAERWVTWVKKQRGPDKKEKDPDPQDLALAYRLFFAVYGKRTILNNLGDYYDRAIAQAKKPYPQGHAALKRPGDLVSVVLIPEASSARFRYAANETQNALLMVSLALQAFHEERGRYPATLNELCPAYLNRLPEDAFAQNGPLRYRRTDKTFLLYSIGPDGSDDSGKAIEDLKKSENQRYDTTETSKGDIVAEKNY